MTAQELTAAAAKLRKTAAAVDAGPPWGVADDEAGLVVSGDLRAWGAPTVAYNLDEGDAAWIALASPAIGGLLADVLDQAARRVGIGQCDATPHPCNHCAELDWGAVGLSAIAHIILGEDS